MDWSAGLSWLATLASRREAPFEATDRADMGTAFGLDASIVATNEGEGIAPPESAPEPLTPWQRNVIRRSGL